MKTKHFIALFALCAGMVFVACQKDDLAVLRPAEDSFIAPRSVTCADGVTRTFPTEVCVDEEFTISAAFTCGKMAIEQQTSGTSCDDGTWTAIAAHACYTSGIVSATLSLSTPGIYRFRTQHLANDGNCDGLGGSNTSGNCGFSGTNFCCFTVEVVECGCYIQPGDYWTYSQGFYSNTNGADLFAAHPELGPVTVGCLDNYTDYSLEQINGFQPGNSTAPGVLVKQIITMTLNLAIQDLLGTGEDLGCLVVVADGIEGTTLDDLFAGMTVDEILAEANNLAGGCGSTFTSGELTGILGAIVNNFHLGNSNNGLLTCCE